MKQLKLRIVPQNMIDRSSYKYYCIIKQRTLDVDTEFLFRRNMSIQYDSVKQEFFLLGLT